MQRLLALAKRLPFFLFLGAYVVEAGEITAAAFATAKFDVIIVGGGTAGLVVANRLSAISSLSVGIIDAGTYNTSGDPLIDIPYGANWYLNQPSASVYGNPNYDWSFKSIPQTQIGGGVINYSRGKVLGGSSAINYMVWQRGAKSEYDTWSSAFGNSGWDFSGLLPYFERAENWTAPPTGASGLLPNTTVSNIQALASVQGSRGPISASYGQYFTDLDRPMTEASVTLGFPLNPNPDGGNSAYYPKFGIADSVNPVVAKRSYAASAYYNPIKSRSNLKLVTGALATRLIWDPKTLNSSSIKASGVEFIVRGTKYVVNATKEVILSAGSIKSPQLLELSGVGNSTLLKQLGIPLVLNFPEVGENLMDHPISISDFNLKSGVKTLDEFRINSTFAGQQRELYANSLSGAHASAWPRVTGSWPLKDIVSPSVYASMRQQLDATLANMKLTPLQKAQYSVMKSLADGGKTGFVNLVMVPYGGLVSVAQPNTSYLTMAHYHVHEFSRGSIHINSSDPTAYPVINPRFLSIPWDVQVQVYGGQFVRKISTTAPVSDLVASVNIPSVNVTTNAQWQDYIESTLGTISHPMGTTVMASKALGGVVDSHLKVYGLANIRVVDAGVIPLTVGYPIQQTVYGVAEKASDLLLQDLGYLYSI